MTEKKDVPPRVVEVLVNKVGSKITVRAEGTNPDAVLAAAQAQINKARGVAEK
jgi:hypothetical protein